MKKVQPLIAREDLRIFRLSAIGDHVMSIKKILLTVLVFCLLSVLRVPGQKAKALELPHNEKNEDIKLHNELSFAPAPQAQSGLIAVYIGEDCSYVIGTLQGDPSFSQDDNRRLLFGYPDNPGTSYPTVRVIDGAAINDFVLTMSSVSNGPYEENDAVVCKWSLGEIEVVQKLTPVSNPFSGRPDTVRIEYEITNVTTHNLEAGLRNMLDMMIGENDYAPFFIPGQGNIVNELEFQSGSIPDFYKALESIEFATDSLKGQGILHGYGATPPDRFVLATWKAGRGEGHGIFDSPWDYEITPNAKIGDSTAVLWWNPKLMAPQQTIKYITYFGLAGPGGGSSWIDVPAEVSPALPNFQATLRVSNQTNQAFTGGTVILTLPPEITSLQPLQQAFPDIQPGQTGSLSWDLAITNGAGGNLIIATDTRFSTLADVLHAQATIFVPPPPDLTNSRPVILIPGMGASYNSDLASKLPGSDYDESKWEWTGTGWPINRDANTESYSGLINAFEAAGYSQDNNYFTVAFYDWRGPISDSGKRLKQVIDEVKRTTGASSVDLVAHSMGGLVAREYITSDYYQYDVTHLVTMGSPFNGSVNPYYYVGGGELHGFDSAQKVLLAIRFLDPFKCDFLYTNTPCWPRNVDIINNVAIGLYDVLPNFEYVYDSASGQATPLSNLYFKNRYLPTSNGKNQLLLTRTKVLNIAGTGQDTLIGLNVKPYPPSQLMWQDGEPVEQRVVKDGDNTVLKDNALISGAESYVLSENHGGYMGNQAVQTKVMEFLGIRSPVGDFPSPHYASSFVVAVASPLEIVITDPQGRRLSPSEAQIPNSFYIGSGTEGPYAAIVPEPLAGSYSIDLIGTGSGEYHFIADYEVNNNRFPTQDPGMDYEFSSVIETNASIHISAQLDPAQTNPLMVISMTPTIELPAYTGNTVIHGYASPGAPVELAETGGPVLGTGQAEQTGKFSITISGALRRGQVIVAQSNGQTSVPVTVIDDPRGNQIGPPNGGGGSPIAFVIIPLAVVGLIAYSFVISGKRNRKHIRSITSSSSMTAKLIIVSGQKIGQVIALYDNFIIGRGNRSSLSLYDHSVSRQHARLRYVKNQWFIQDIASAGGTYVNGYNIKATPLKNGDRIRIGSSEFEFRE